MPTSNGKRNASAASTDNLVETVTLLDDIATEKVPNQRTLARNIGVSVGMVNALVHRAVTKGLIKIKQAPLHRYAYYLTPKGFAEKSRLVSEYLDVSLTFFRMCRREYAEIFSRCAATGRKRVILCGAGELAEIATLSVNNTGVELVAVFDRETNQAQVAGLPVLRDLAEVGPNEVFVITDDQNAQETHDRLVALGRDNAVLHPKFLRISAASGAANLEAPR